MATCEHARCLAEAVGWAVLTGYGLDRAAYGCAVHIDATIVGYRNGFWPGALLTIQHLDSGEWERIERMPTPADVLRSAAGGDPC